jgi:hypothetical protein
MEAPEEAWTGTCRSILVELKALLTCCSSIPYSKTKAMRRWVATALTIFASSDQNQ